MRHPDDHLDEGTIHAWLDGALGDDESRAVEAHVARCAECSAAVAEARGLIAAASGILAKLDVVPAGVVPRPVPVAPTAETGARVLPIDSVRRGGRTSAWWRSSSLRVAAALLVVATGTFAVVRERGPDERAAGVSLIRNESRKSASVTRAVQEAPVPASAPAATPQAPIGFVPESGAMPQRAADAVAGAREAEAPPMALPVAPPAAPPQSARRAATRAAPQKMSGVVVTAPPAPLVERGIAGSTIAVAPAPTPPPAPEAQAATAAAAPGSVAGNVAVGAGTAKRSARDEAAAQRQAAPADASSDLARLRSEVAPASVAGTVREAASGRPIQGTSVRVIGTNRGAVTDSEGRFAIVGVPAGRQVVEARSIGYKSASAEVVVRADSTVLADLRLPVQTLMLSEVVVTGAEKAAPSVTARAAGCYRLAFGAWTPALAAPALPGRIALETARSDAPLVAPVDSAFSVRANEGSPAWRYAYWAPLGSDSVRVVWSDGTAGAEARLRLDGRNLRGSVATFSDDERRTVQRTTVTLRRTSCQAP